MNVHMKSGPGDREISHLPIIINIYWFVPLVAQQFISSLKLVYYLSFLHSFTYYLNDWKRGR